MSPPFFAIVSATLLALAPSTAFANVVAPFPVSAPSRSAERQVSKDPNVPSAAEVLLGDRLFFDSRFSQYFFANSNGDVNAKLAEGDQVMDAMPALAGTTLLGQPLEGRFRGQSMNCRNCHLGDDFLYEQPLAGRTYCDFSVRSPIPARGDGQVETPRNAPLMINLGLPREVPELLHFDGEFASMEDLVIDTMTGRNFGWLPNEVPQAVAHIAKVIREDEGTNPRLVKYLYGVGVPYRVAMLGTDPNLPYDLRIPPEYRIDVDSASDEEILLAIGKLMHAYTNSLRFGTKNTRRTAGSPYDLFLAKNRLPPGPAENETDRAYAQRLLRTLERRESFDWVTPADGKFELHRQAYEFGPLELQGLEIFLRRAGSEPEAHVGNCVACHPPPQFTDYRLHNNGVAQAQYDAVFGKGSFAALDIPDLAERSANHEAHLPATPKHPQGTGRFKSAPSADKPGHADLGVWNVYANPDMPKPQPALRQILCGSAATETESADCRDEDVLPRTVGLFKTPSIRDLGQSNPYFHSGSLGSIEEVLRYYVVTSDQARADELRNGSPEMKGVQIEESDVVPLAAFLRSLNEDYH
jgi:cytochrome c peroxidase